MTDTFARDHLPPPSQWPDLLLLDIQMPGLSGFDVLDRLDDVPQVIFTTAYDAYAIKAFEVNALDYLLKPIAPARLAAASAESFKSGAKCSRSAIPCSPIM